MKHICSLMVGVWTMVIAGSAVAQSNYPEKSIRIIVGTPPGSGTDITARLLGQKYTEAWGKPVVIHSIAGAAGNIATERIASAVPDGYTLGLLSQVQLAINPGLYKLAQDPLKDFAPISQISGASNVLVVHNAVPAKNVQELIKLAKARPGELTYASGGSGSASHMVAELLKSAAGIDIRHIPYKGVGAAIPDLLGGRVTMSIGPSAVVLPLARDGKVRALAVTSLRRSSAAPELPTISESGYPGFELTNWWGLVAPARTPATVIGKLHVETVKALALPELRAKFADLGVESIGNSPAEFAAVIKSEIPKWAKVIKDADMKPD